MKVLTLTQPWATLVAIGAKKIETRSWPTKYRGPLAIHASKVFPKWARELMWMEPFFSALGAWGRRHSFSLGLPLGKIIAVCELADCVEILEGGSIQSEEPEHSFGDYTPGRFAWILENIRELKEPIPARGALGLWNYSGQLPPPSNDS